MTRSSNRAGATANPSVIRSAAGKSTSAVHQPAMPFCVQLQELVDTYVSEI
jgi:hypothetical protein